MNNPVNANDWTDATKYKAKPAAFRQCLGLIASVCQLHQCFYETHNGVRSNKMWCPMGGDLASPRAVLPARTLFEQFDGTITRDNIPAITEACREILADEADYLETFGENESPEVNFAEDNEPDPMQGFHASTPERVVPIVEDNEADNIGTKGGLCNRTACRAPDAFWFNHSTRKHYCENCAHDINGANRNEAREMYGHELCTYSGSDVSVLARIESLSMTWRLVTGAAQAPETLAEVVDATPEGAALTIGDTPGELPTMDPTPRENRGSEGQFAYELHMHTKTGADLHLVVNKGKKLDRDEWEKLSEQAVSAGAKGRNGWQREYNPRHSDVYCPGGWRFETAEEAQAFVASLNGGAPPAPERFEDVGTRFVCASVEDGEASVRPAPERFKGEMVNVREYAEDMQVELVYRDDRPCLLALNEGGHNCTKVDLLDVIDWVMKHMPELLRPKKPQGAFRGVPIYSEGTMDGKPHTHAQCEAAAVGCGFVHVGDGVYETHRPFKAPAPNTSKYEKMAETFDKQAEECLAERQENTPKRRAQAAHKRLKGWQAQRAAKIARAVAYQDVLLPMTPRKEDVFRAAAVNTEPVANGLHGYSVEAAGWACPGGEYVALRQLAGLDKPQERTPEELKAEALREIDKMDIPGFFPTPPEVVGRMMDMLELEPERLYHWADPSAGTGAIAKVAEQFFGWGKCLLLEASPTLANFLMDHVHPLSSNGVQCDDFLSLSPHAGTTFDVILMNPPFERIKGVGWQAVAHVSHALDFLAPGGQLVAVMPAGWCSKQDKQTVELWNVLSRPNTRGIVEMRRELLPSGSFKASGTGVNTELLYVRKGEA